MLEKKQPKHNSLLVKLFMLAILFLMSVSSYAKISFYNINDLFGISMRETASACMDDYGFVWVSSKTGIMRLTEDDYRIYQLPYDSPNIISVKLVFKNSKLYAYTNNGQIFQYNAVFDRFDKIVNLGRELNFSYLMVYNMLIDSQGNFWVSSSIGLISYKNKSTKVYIEGVEFNFIEWYDDGTLILSTRNEIALFDAINGKLDFKLSDLPTKQTNISKLYFDKAANKIWIGTMSMGLLIYDLSAKTFTNVAGIPKQPILAMDFISDSIMLVGIDGQGLWEVDKVKLTIENVYKENSDNPNSIRGNGIYDIFYDKANTVWVCTYSGGVSYFKQTPPLVTHLEHITNESNSLVNNDVNDVLEDSRGFLWFATNNGVSRWNLETNKWSSYYYNKQEQAQVFLSLCEDAEGNIWAGTYASGVYIINGATGKEMRHLPQSSNDSLFNNSFIFDILRDSNDNIWSVGTQGDVISYDSKTRKFRNYGFQSVYSIKEYKDNKMLLGCSFGLSILNKETGAMNILLSGYLVHDLLVYDNHVWLCTIGEGLVQFNMVTGSIVKYNTEAGLPSNFVNSIYYDDGYFWLGTENGICKFNPETKSVETFPSIAPLWRLAYNRHSYFKRSNGEIMWGTNRGVVMFNPSLIHQTHSNGRIFIQDISVLGRSLRSGILNELSSPVNSLDLLHFKHNHNTLSIEMLPMGMAYGAKFSWKLEGLDPEWTKPTNNRILNYTNLPTGTFVLKIRMYDNSLSEIVDERVITIVKAPPFWSTWWFLSLVTLVLLGTFIFSMKYYIGLINQYHSEEKIRFFANTAHDMRTSLTLIKAPLDELSNEPGLTANGKYFLKTAKVQAERLAKVVTQLMDFQKADVGKEQLALESVNLVELIKQRVVIFQSVARKNKIHIEFSSAHANCFSMVDQAMIEKVVDNLLSNAIKYSRPEGKVEVLFSNTASHWVLDVKDYGIGISKEAQRQLFKEFYRGENAVNSKIVGSGIGLLLAKKYITLHEGEISCFSELNQGSTFKLSVPVKVPLEPKIEEVTETDINISGNADIIEPQVLQQKSFSIVVVEDNDDLRHFLEQTLQSEFLIASARNGADGWEIIQKEIPDLIISDIMMPQMDGFELCRLVKSTYETSCIPVILLTSLSDKTDQLQGLGLGADDYLTKPFDIPLLKQRIRTIIANRQVVREKALKLIKGSDNEPILSNELNDQFLKKAIEVVRNNMSNTEFNKDLFAKELNVSGSLLYKKIKSLTDQSPSDFIKSIRLTHSLELLQSRNYTITEVSENCGFAAVGYFSTVFKRHFGKSPSDILEDV